MYKNFLALNDLSDEELIQLVQNRNEAAFAELMSRWTSRIWGVIVANSRQLRDAEEIHTDIWIAVWQNIRELRNVDSFGAWLHRIAYNECKRYYISARKSRHEIPHQHSAIVEQIDQYAAARYREAHLIADVKEALHHLPQKIRSVAELFYLESWSIKEIAVELNLAIGTVKTKLREIRKRLREEFDVEAIRGEVMSSKDVETHIPIQIETYEAKPSMTPALLNVVADDPTGNTWAIPEGAIVRLGKGGNRGGSKLSPNGTHFAVATSTGLWWYDVSSVLPVSLWEPGKGYVSSINFSPDGNWGIISTISAGNGTIKIMDIQSGECIMQIEDHDVCKDLACSSNGKWVATASKKGVVKVLDIQTGECIAQMDRGEHIRQSNDISQLQFSPDGKLLAAHAGNPKLYSNDDELLNPDTEGDQIYVWCPISGKVILKFAGQEFTFSSDSRLLAVTCPDETLNDDESVDRWISVWDVTSRELLTQFTEHDDWINTIAFSPCGQFVASSDGILRVWDIATGSEKNVYPHFPDCQYIFYSAKGELFVVIVRSPTLSIEVWNVEHREKIYEISDIEGMGYGLAFAYIKRLANTASYKQTDGKIPKFSTVREPIFPEWFDLDINWLDDQTLVSNGSTGIVLWSVDKKCYLDTVSIDGEIDAITVLPSGKMLVSYFPDYMKMCVASVPFQLIAELAFPDELSELNRFRVFSPTGEYFATGSSEGTVYVWNLKQPEHPIRLKGHTDYVYRCEFSWDGKRLVSGASDETARVWDVELGKEIARLPVDESDTAWGFVFSPSGNLIAGSLDNEIRLWCAKQFTKVRSIPQPKKNRQTHPLAFSPCGQYLAAATWWQEGSEDMAIRIWDVNSGEQVHAFQGHNSLVQSLAFSPNGSMLAIGCCNSTILVWDLKQYL